MKKTNLLLLFCLLTTSLLFVSCNPEEPENDGPDVYTPDKNLTSHQVIQLINEAIEATNSENRFTLTIKQDSQSAKIEADLSAKKFLARGYLHQRTGYNLLTNLQYADGDSMYEYELSEGEEYFTLRYTQESFWDEMNYSDIIFEEDVDDFDWVVNGDKLIGTLIYNDEYYSEYSYTETLMVTLDSKKRIKQIEFKFEETDNPSSNKKYSATYEYTANPKFPNEFSKDFFTRIPEYILNIDWGLPFGVKRYITNYISNDQVYFYLSQYDAPSIEGKVPEFYEDVALLNKINSTWYYGYGQWNFVYRSTMDTSGKTIYAKWIPESEAENPEPIPTYLPNIAPKAKKSFWKMTE